MTARLAVVFVIVLYSTLLHAAVVSQARYNLPLVPILVAAGVAALTVSLSKRRSVGKTVNP